MTDKTLPQLYIDNPGGTVSSGDLFLTRQGADTSDSVVTATQLAAFMGGGGSSLVRKLQTQSGWYLTPETYGATTGSTLSINQTYVVPVFIDQSATFTAIAAYNSSGSAANIKLGVYEHDGVNEPTGSPISGTTGTVASPALVGAIEHTFASPVTLTAGIYWLAMLLQTAIGCNAIAQTGYSNIVGVDSMANANGRRFYFASTPYASGLPDATSLSLSYQTGLGPVWMGLKAQ